MDTKCESQLGSRARSCKPARWQRGPSALLAVSGLGTLLAGLALIFDGWIDALALYAACVLALVLMLSHFAGRQTQPQAVVFASDERAHPGSRPAGLVLTGASGAWTGTDRSAVPAALGNAAPID